MIEKKNQGGLPTTEGVNAFLGRRSTLKGRIRFEGMFRVDGKYDGRILSGDSLVVGETAEVNAKIHVNTVTVHGTVNGKITAKKRILIYPSGKILGDIQTPVLIVSEGAIFEGSCQMGIRKNRREEEVSPPELKEKDNREIELKKT